MATEVPSRGSLRVNVTMMGVILGARTLPSAEMEQTVCVWLMSNKQTVVRLLLGGS